MRSSAPSEFLLACEWVYPISSPPLQHGAVVVSRGSIKEIGPFHLLTERYPKIPIFEYSHGLLMPGLVNVHAHLEYTSLGLLPAGDGFIPWILSLVKKNRVMTPEERYESALQGCKIMLSNGITTAGEVSYSGESSLEAMKRSGMKGTVYLEVFGTRERYGDEDFLPIRQKVEKLRTKAEGAGIRIGLSPHAPYTVSPALWQKVSEYANQENIPLTFHLAESMEETLLVKEKRGPFQDHYYPSMGMAAPATFPSGLSPAKYLDDHHLLFSRSLAVHGLELNAEERSLLGRRGVSLALCPGSNRYLHGKLPDFPALMESGVLMGLGTDSQTSNPHLDLLEEMKILHEAFKGSTDWGTLLTLGTLNGARILGMESTIGTLEVGKKANMIGVHWDGDKTPMTWGDKKILFTMVEGHFCFESSRE